MIKYDFVSFNGIIKTDINTQYLTEEWANKKTGGLKFTLTHEHSPADIIFYPEYRKLKIGLSAPYFLFGHNFNVDIHHHRNAFDYISNVIDYDILGMDVDCLESYVILPVHDKPTSILNNHLSAVGMKKQIFETGIEFKDRNLRLKLYDIKANYKRKLPVSVKKTLSESALHSGVNYLKIENHYKRPQVSLKRREITGYTIFEDNFQELCTSDLIEKYSAIKKSSSLVALKKADINVGTIPLLVLKEYEQYLPMPITEILKEKIKSFPEDILTAADKKKRWQGVNRNMDKLKKLGGNPNDLINEIKVILLNQLST